MDDLIKRDDALAAIDTALNNATGDLFDCHAAIHALPAMTVGVKPLDQFGVRELARASGISPTTAMRVKRGEGDLDGSTLRAVLAATGTCLCCGSSPQPIDPAAIREAALREAALRIGGMIRGHDKTEYEEGYNDALATAERHILALIGEKE